MTATELHDKLAEIGADLTISTLDTIIHNGKLNKLKQNDKNSTYAPLLKKEDGQIVWNQGALEIDRQIRALNPWPGVFCEADNKRLKILEAKPLSETTDKPIGTILDKSGRIACGNGTILKLEKLQPAGKQSMDFVSALNGNYIKIGQVLS